MSVIRHLHCLCAISLISLLSLISLVLLSPTILLSSEVFIPDENNSWAFPSESADPAAASPMDLRWLNETFAGANGPLHLSADGSDFIRGDGKTMKAWMIHLPTGYFHKDKKEYWSYEDYVHSARFYARLGVNVGIIGVPNPSNPERPASVHPASLESIHRSVAAAKAAGMYTQLRVAWFHGIKGKQLGFDFHQEKDLMCLVQFHPQVQAMWKSWVREMLCSMNPHTQLALKDDPALFSIEIANEDSLLFFTVDRIKGAARHEFEHQFYQWCMKKYTSIDAARVAWNQAADKADDPDQKRLGLVLVWFLTRAGYGKYNEQRCQDQLSFLVETMQQWQREAKSFIKDELGAKHILIAGSNFNPADRVVLDDALRLIAWKDVDIIENNHYFDDRGKGDASYRIDVGYIQGLRSAVVDPLGLPTNKRQVAGKPFFCTEILWPRPNPYAVEGPLLVAAYQSMNGIDGLAWAGPRGKTWEGVYQTYYPFWNVDGHIPLRRWSCGGPDVAGQFPAAAAILRLGLLKQAPSVITEERRSKDIIARKEPLIAEQFAYDPTQYGKDLDALPLEADGAHKEAFLIGRVTIALNDENPKSQVSDLRPFIKDGAIYSATNELCMNLKKRLFTIDAPAVQAAVGFLRDNKRIELSHATITCDLEHGSICILALDGKTLANSEKIFIQIGARAAPTGWKESAATYERNKKQRSGLRVDATGALPWRVRKCHGSITLKSGVVTKMIVLDGNGIPQHEQAIVHDGGAIHIQLPDSACYVVLEK